MSYDQGSKKTNSSIEKYRYIFTVILALMGGIGYWLTWAAEIRNNNTSRIEKKIEMIEARRDKINAAVMNARTIVDNQNLLLCVQKNNNTKLIEARATRNQVTDQIELMSSAIRFEVNNESQQKLDEVSKLFRKISIPGICHINIDKFDTEIQFRMRVINHDFANQVTSLKELISKQETLWGTFKSPL